MVTSEHLNLPTTNDGCTRMRTLQKLETYQLYVMLMLGDAAFPLRAQVGMTTSGRSCLYRLFSVGRPRSKRLQSRWCTFQHSTHCKMSSCELDDDCSADNVATLLLPGIRPWQPLQLLQSAAALDFVPVDDVTSSSDDEDDDGLTLDNVRHVCNMRLCRSVGTWTFSGWFLDAVEGVHPEPDGNWSTLPEHERDRRWLHIFCMYEGDLAALYNWVAPHLEDRGAYARSYRVYIKRKQLLVTMYTWRTHTRFESWRRLGSCTPASQCAASILASTPCAEFLLRRRRPNIRFPRDEAGLKAIAAKLENKYKLCGCFGPIDGTVIPMRKPRRHSVGGNSDSYWCYKGYPAILLLAMVDADGLFTYISAGAPGNVGDSGPFSHSALKRNIDDSMLRKFQFELPVVGQTHRI